MSIVEIANQVKLVSLGSLVVIVAIIVKMVERKKLLLGGPVVAQYNANM